MFMIAVGSAVGTAAGAGAVSARSSPELNGESELSPIPRAETTVEIDEVEIGGDPLAFTADDGASSSLESYGGTVTPAPVDADGDIEPHNPFTLRADRIASSEFSSFPRGETDADDEDISALEAEYWSTLDEEASVSDTTPASGWDAIEFATDGVVSGGEAAIEFTHVDISSGVLRKELQSILSIATVDGTVELRVGDGTDWAVATVDPDGAADDVDTIATAAGDGIVYQSPIGDLVSDLDEITTIQLAAVDGDATLELSALNVERESSWSFGEREVYDTDDDGEEIDEIRTEEYVEPVGEFDVASLESLDSVFQGAEATPVRVDVEYYPVASELATGEPSNPAYDTRAEIVQNIEVPSAYDLSHDPIDVVLEVGLSGDQWTEVEVATDVEETLALGDRDDEETVDYLDDVETSSVGDDVGLGEMSSGERVAIFQSIDLTDDQLDEIESGEVAGFFSGGGGGGFLSTPMGVIATIGSGIAAYVAIARGWVAGVLGGS